MGVAKEMLRSSKYRVVALASAVAYWFLYAVSSGTLQYYGMDLTALLRTSQVPNPYYFVEWNNFLNFYDSGMVWYSTGHLQLNLLFGPTFFSILLSVLFALNFLLIVYSLRAQGVRKGTGISGLVGMVPALFSGGCCSVPLGMSLFGSLLPSTALFSFAFNYVYLTNTSVALLMWVSFAHASKKVASCNCAT